MPCLAYCRKTTKQLNDVTEMCIFQIQIKLGLLPRATRKQTSISVECCIVHTCTCLHTMPKNVSRLDNFSLMHSKNSDFLSISVLHDFISNKYFKCNWFFSVEWKNCIFFNKNVLWKLDAWSLLFLLVCIVIPHSFCFEKPHVNFSYKPKTVTTVWLAVIVKQNVFLRRNTCRQNFFGVFELFVFNTKLIILINTICNTWVKHFGSLPVIRPKISD